VGLGLTWASVLAIILSAPSDGWSVGEVLMRVPWVLPLVLLMGYTFAWMRATFAAGMEGRAGYLAWPENVPLQTVRGVVEAAVTFLAGPVVPLAVAFVFWLNSGELELVDRLILWELGLVAAAYWALALLAMWEGERFRDANPLAVWRLIRREGYRVPLAALLAAVVVVGHGRACLGVLEELQQEPASAWLTLFVCWAGLMFWLMALLRWLGVSRFRTWKRRRKQNPLPESGDEEFPGPTSEGSGSAERYCAAGVSPKG
jgi:hypothetical protein